MTSNPEPDMNPQNAIILSHPTAPRIMAFLPDPVPCPVCKHMAMIVIVTVDSTTCIGCAPEMDV